MSVPTSSEVNGPDLQELEAIAQSIPTMGGDFIGHHLREHASSVTSDDAIVEVGCWMGFGTAQLALGVIESADNPTIHVYDWWQATKSEAEKLEQYGYGHLGVKEGDNTLPIVQELLAPFTEWVDIRFHQVDINHCKWNQSTPIGLYVDDAAKKRRTFAKIRRTFGPAWIPGRTPLVLMDYWYFEKTDKPFEGQYNWEQRNRASLETLVARAEDDNTRILLFTPPHRFARWRALYA